VIMYEVKVRCVSCPRAYIVYVVCEQLRGAVRGVARGAGEHLPPGAGHQGHQEGAEKIPTGSRGGQKN